MLQLHWHVSPLHKSMWSGLWRPLRRWSDTESSAQCHSFGKWLSWILAWSGNSIPTAFFSTTLSFWFPASKGIPELTQVFWGPVWMSTMMYMFVWCAIIPLDCSRCACKSYHCVSWSQGQNSWLMLRATDILTYKICFKKNQYFVRSLPRSIKKFAVDSFFHSP